MGNLLMSCGAHDRLVTVACCFCKAPMQLPADEDGIACEHLGPPYHHDGCAGFPYCACAVAHEGDCPTPPA